MRRCGGGLRGGPSLQLSSSDIHATCLYVCQVQRAAARPVCWLLPAAWILPSARLARPPYLQVSGELGSANNDVIAPQVSCLSAYRCDGLCSLAALARSELCCAAWLHLPPHDPTSNHPHLFNVLPFDGTSPSVERCAAWLSLQSLNPSQCGFFWILFSIIFVPQDVAIYGALCGMAALGRKELATCLLRNVAFRELLELVPEVGCLSFEVL